LTARSDYLDTRDLRPTPVTADLIARTYWDNEREYQDAAKRADVLNTSAQLALDYLKGLEDRPEW
ncbi:MAG TPA: hypothetical protein VH375_06770, partial [Rhodanobacteraceae bacterium]